MIRVSKEYYPYIGVTLLYIILAIVNVDSGYDKLFDIWWSEDIFNAGISNIYDTTSVNYPPLVLYILHFYTLCFDQISDINLDTINYLKPVKVFFDLVLLYELIYFIKKQKRNIWIISFFVFNLAFWYDSLIWAQYDSMVGAFLIASFLMAFEKKWYLMVLFFMLSLNTKHIPIIFFPVLFLIAAKDIKFNLSLWGKLIGLAVCIQTLILFPFIINGNLYEVIDAIFLRTVSHHDSISLRAYNIWYFLFQEGDPFLSSDKLPFMGLNYLKWGFIFFFSFFFLIMAYPIKMFLNKTLKLFSERHFFLLAGLIGIGFYYFNTEMHERYLHLPLLFLGFYSISSKQWAIFVFLSFTFLCTLESVMQFFRILNVGPFNESREYLDWFIFNPKFMATEVSLCLGYYSVLYFKELRTIRKIEKANE